MRFLGLEISKKVLIGIIVGVVAVGGVTTGVILMNNNKDNQKQEEKQKDTILLKEDLNFEINSEVNLLSMVSEENKVKILSEDEKIDTSILGEKEITIKYEIEEKEETKTFKIMIVDTQAPTIEYKKELSTNVGTKIDLLKYVKVNDNSKEEIKATIEGDYNFDNEGTYNLKYVAVDSSNNKKEEEFTLKVNKKTTSNNKPQTNNNSSNNNKPQTNNNSNNDFTDIEADCSKAKALYDKYRKKYVWSKTKVSEFSPEPGVYVQTQNTPRIFHYEWNPMTQKWYVVADSGYVTQDDWNYLNQLYPAPNRPGKEICSSPDANGVTSCSYEKTEKYTIYCYEVSVKTDTCHAF